MLDFIKDWAINIVTLVLFIVMIEMLLPKGRVKKYVNLITGTILIIAIIDPFTGLFGESFDFSSAQVSAASALDRKEIEKAGLMLEEEQVKQTIALYRIRIIRQIENQAKEVEGVKGAKADVIVNEDCNSDAFGEIKRIYIEAEIKHDDTDARSAPSGEGACGSGENYGSDSSRIDENEGASEIISTTAVEKIESVRIGNSQLEIQQAGHVDSELADRLSDRIGEVFGISREDIIITQIQR